MDSEAVIPKQFFRQPLLPVAVLIGKGFYDMNERIEFWRGFAGGLLVGVVVGAFSYFSSKEAKTSRRISSSSDDRKDRGALPQPLEMTGRSLPIQIDAVEKGTIRAGVPISS